MHLFPGAGVTAFRAGHVCLNGFVWICNLLLNSSIASLWENTPFIVMGLKILSGGDRGMLFTELNNDNPRGVLSESRELSGEDFRSAFRDNGVIGKGARNSIGSGGKVIGRFHIGQL